LQDHGSGFHQTVKPKLVKIGIRPALMITPSGSALLSLMLAQNASQASANPTIQFAERRWLAVFEVFKPVSPGIFQNPTRRGNGGQSAF
jgi:hypothetical protein